MISSPPVVGDIVAWIRGEEQIYFLVLKIDGSIITPYHCQNLLSGRVERFETGCFNNVCWRFIA